jgi:hypothetical protein
MYKVFLSVSVSGLVVLLQFFFRYFLGARIYLSLHPTIYQVKIIYFLLFEFDDFLGVLRTNKTCVAAR